MKQFKKAKVVMLPTEDKSNICIVKLNDKNILVNNKGYNSQHLYFLTDDRIEKEDWCYDKRDNAIFKIKVNLEDGDGCGLIFKIISTTDTSLMTTVSVPHIGEQPNRKMLDVIKLPQPPQEFIEKYVESYNKGEVITDVLVEYELQSYSNRFEDKKPIGDSETWGKRLSLKINSDNTIIIKQEKETLRDIMMKNPDIRGEVVQLLNEVIRQSKEQYSLLDRLGLDKWIEENL